VRVRVFAERRPKAGYLFLTATGFAVVTAFVRPSAWRCQMRVRRLFGRHVVAGIAAATVALGSWLLVADPGLGRTHPTPGTGTTTPADGIRPLTHGYGGYSRVCRPARLQVLSNPEEFIRGGNVRCFSSNGNATGDNVEMSTDAFIVDSLGNVTNMTRDVRRCVEGSNEGNTCSTDTDCPNGSCQDLHVGDCVADRRGRFVYFIFDGNPTGQNADLGDELFRFDTRSKQLTQLTQQPGWCNSDPSKPCDRSSACGLTDRCVRAQMSTQQFSGYGGSRTVSGGVELTPDGVLVWFLSNGDPTGTNSGHTPTLFVLATRGNNAIRPVVSAGGFCSAESTNHGHSCVKDSDCGAVCGDGRIQPPEQCEPFLQPSACPTGQYCAFPSTPQQCTCQTPICGNGIREPGEVCDPPGQQSKFCAPGLVCHSDCRACVTTPSPSGAFL
jgi:hypothetical protein